jgi:hypothetical protein
MLLTSMSSEERQMRQILSHENVTLQPCAVGVLKDEKSRSPTKARQNINISDV